MTLAGFPLARLLGRALLLLCVVSGAVGVAARARGQALEPGDLVVADRQGTGPARLIRVEGATGATHTLYASFDGVLVAPRDIEIDASGIIFASQSAIPTKPAPESVVRVDPSTGVATLVTQGDKLHDVDGIAIAGDGALYAADHGSVYGVPPAIVRIDRATGAQTVVTSGLELVRPIDVLVEADGSLLVLDGGNGSGAKLVRVDVASGAQTVLVAPGPLGAAAGGFALDADGSIVVANAFGVLYRVAAATGAVTNLAGGTGLVTTDLALEPDGDALMLAGGNSDRVDRVDFGSGAAKTLATGFETPTGLAVVPSPTPFCDVEVEKPTYKNGDVVRVTTLRFANPLTSSFRTRLQVRLAVASVPTPIDLITYPILLPARLDAELAPFNMFQVQASLPRGSYELRCSLEDPLTNATQYQNAAPFGLE